MPSRIGQRSRKKMAPSEKELTMIGRFHIRKKIIAVVCAALACVVVGATGLAMHADTYVPPIKQWQFDHLMQQGMTAYPPQGTANMFNKNVRASTNSVADFDIDPNTQPGSLLPVYRIMPNELTNQAELEVAKPVSYIGLGYVEHKPRYWTLLQDIRTPDSGYRQVLSAMHVSRCDEWQDYCTWFDEAADNNASLISVGGTSDGDVYFMMKNRQFTPLSPIAQTWVCGATDRTTMLEGLSAYYARRYSAPAKQTQPYPSEDPPIQCYG